MGKNLLTNWHKKNCLDGLFWVRVTRKMLNVNWEKIHSIILSVTCDGLGNFSLLIHIPSKPYMTHPTPPLYDTPHPTPTWPTHPTPALHNTPHPTPPLHGPPTPPLHDPPHPTLAWPTLPHPTPPLHDPPHPCMTHPTLPHPHPYMTHPTPPHPCMTHPTPPHPCMAHPTPPPPPHPCMTPPPPHPHPCMTHPTPTPPHPWNNFGKKWDGFHGVLHYVSLLVDNEEGKQTVDDR